MFNLTRGHLGMQKIYGNETLMKQPVFYKNKEGMLVSRLKLEF
jgi:hypothetical protein